MQSTIKELLKNKGVTISNLAVQLGISQASLSRALGENGNPTLETLNKIASALGVSTSELFDKPAKGTITCPHCGKEITIKAE